MNFNRLLLTAALLTIILTGCDQDTDTPANLKRETYYSAGIQAADLQVVSCDGARYTLPKSDGTETLGLYILKIHAANRDTPLSSMEIADMQKLYQNCLRPAILQRLREP
jgi:hypothetical protein